MPAATIFCHSTGSNAWNCDSSTSDKSSFLPLCLLITTNFRVYLRTSTLARRHRSIKRLYGILFFPFLYRRSELRFHPTVLASFFDVNPIFCNNSCTSTLCFFLSMSKYNCSIVKSPLSHLYPL